MYGNGINNSANSLATMNDLKRSLLRGKSREQKDTIKFFFKGGGCLSSRKTIQAYEQKVRSRIETLDTKKMALHKLGIDEEEVQEIEPVTFEGYVFSDKTDNLVLRVSHGWWVSSDYMITWLFFGEREVFIYQYSFSMISDSKKESTSQYFYQDVTNFTTSSETYQKIVPAGGCLSNKFMQESVNADEFKIIVPGDTLHCSMVPNDNADTSIRAMRNKLREMKNR